MVFDVGDVDHKVMTGDDSDEHWWSYVLANHQVMTGDEHSSFRSAR